MLPEKKASLAHDFSRDFFESTGGSLSNRFYSLILMERLVYLLNMFFLVTWNHRLLVGHKSIFLVLAILLGSVLNFSHFRSGG